MKAEKSAIRPWLTCQYTENTLMDEPWVCPILFMNLVPFFVQKNSREKIMPVQKKINFLSKGLGRIIVSHTIYIIKELL